jgi:hypothetical protein
LVPLPSLSVTSSVSAPRPPWPQRGPEEGTAGHPDC